MSLAKVHLSGTVISDVEKRYTPNGHGVTNFTIEVPNLNTRQPGMFQVKVTCWRGLAEGVPTQIAKGDVAVVEGKLMVNQDQESPAGGMQRRYYEVEATNVYKVAGTIQEVQHIMTQQGDSQTNQGAPQGQVQPQPQMQQAPQQVQPQQAQPQQAVPAGGFSSDDLLTEDDIPF